MKDDAKTDWNDENPDKNEGSEDFGKFYNPDDGSGAAPAEETP